MRARLTRKTDSSATQMPPARRHRSAGRPLEESDRAAPEGLLGHDFSAVRVHADAGAAASAQSPWAHAYTFGDDIVFGAGRYAPGTAGGRRLLAHELTHVVQQERGLAEGAALEREARAAELGERPAGGGRRAAPPAPFVQLAPDQAAIRARLQEIGKQLGELRARQQKLDGSFTGSALEETERESLARGRERLKAEARSASAAPHLFGGTFAGPRIRQAASAALSGTDVGSPGVELPSNERRLFATRFGHDFSKVRVHSGREADTSARALGARAYAFGTHIVFAAGRYAPGRPEGRALLAHELAHVVEQSNAGTWCIQRAPDDKTPTDAGISPDATPQLDPDANEAAARAQSPQLPNIDRDKQTPQQNEDAVRAVVMAAFGTDDALNAAFETLAPSVKKEVDKYAGSGPDAMTANRAQFFVRMRLYFDSWADVLTHFRQFRRVNRGPVDVVLHEDAAGRLDRVLDVLKKHGHLFPSIGVGFGLRGMHRGAFQTQGYMIHALGYAVDVAAAENPKIAFMKPGAGPEKHDPVQIAASIDPSGAHMNMGKSSPTIIEAMGKRTATYSSLSAAEDTDPVAKDYFQRFAQQFQQMQTGSLGFLGTITKSHRDQLLELRSEYFDKLRALAAERKKGTKADAKVLAGLEAQRRKVLGAMPALMTEWITSIDAAIAKTLKGHPGMEKLRSPAEISKDLSAADVTLAQASASETQAQRAKARAMAERDVASEAKQQAERYERRAPSGKEFKRALEATAAARQKLTEKIDAVAEAIERELDTRSALAGATEARRAWDWITSLRELRQALSAPDLSTPAGVKAFERLTTGDLTRIAPVDNPPLLRLLEAGFFNPAGAFDLAFFEEMAHSGFWPGATWNFGGADPMHFELLEGRNRIRSPGNFKLKP